MNIFFLFLSAVESAQALCDKHVVKMPLEMAQLLSTAYRSLYGQRPKTKQYKNVASTLAEDVPYNGELYKLTHYNHPMAIWVRTSVENFTWTLEHGVALCNEWRLRYNHPVEKQHACMRIFTFMQQHLEDIRPLFPEQGFTVPPQCVGEYRVVNEEVTFEGVIQSYRRYYVGEKLGFARWEKMPKRKPEFITLFQPNKKTRLN